MGEPDVEEEKPCHQGAKGYPDAILGRVDEIDGKADDKERDDDADPLEQQRTDDILFEKYGTGVTRKEFSNGFDRIHCQGKGTRPNGR